MLKACVYTILGTVTLLSCRRTSGDSPAQKICDCYDSIHNESAMSNNPEELEQKVNACNSLFISTLASYGDDENKKASFMKEYRNCQEN